MGGKYSGADGRCVSRLCCHGLYGTGNAVVVFRTGSRIKYHTLYHITAHLPVVVVQIGNIAPVFHRAYDPAVPLCIPVRAGFDTQSL